MARATAVRFRFPFTHLFPELRGEVRRHLGLADRASLARTSMAMHAETPVPVLHPLMHQLRKAYIYGLVLPMSPGRTRRQTWSRRRCLILQLDRWLQALHDVGEFITWPGVFTDCLINIRSDEHVLERIQQAFHARAPPRPDEIDVYLHWYDTVNDKALWYIIAIRPCSVRDQFFFTRGILNPWPTWREDLGEQDMGVAIKAFLAQRMA